MLLGNFQRIQSNNQNIHSLVFKKQCKPFFPNSLSGGQSFSERRSIEQRSEREGEWGSKVQR